jgi:hypothetical protein
MVSDLKSETARINGAKSRGPTTAEGKEKSSRNAIKHGLTAGNGNILLDSEDPDQFDEVIIKLLAIHQPATPAEEDIVEEMVAARWRIRRMCSIETGLLNAEILAQQSKSDAAGLNVDLAVAFRTLSDDSHSLALASRYEARLQRLYDRAYKTLRELQQVRKSEEPTPSQNIRIMWVDPKEAMAAHNPSVSEGPKDGPGKEPDSPCETNPPALETELRNEPTGARVQEVNKEPRKRNAVPVNASPSGAGVVPAPRQAP